MKANELRIGNYLNFSKADTQQVTAKSLLGINNKAYEYVEPIPLTEEWLLKFGFDWQGKGGKWLTKFTPSGKAIVLVDGYIRFTGTTIETPVKHVHTLQNLYFALTGEELTIKETNV